MADTIRRLLDLSKETAANACELLRRYQGETLRDTSISASLPREIKAVADEVMEKTILSALKPCGLPILSEESGELPGESVSGMRFIIDPLDGTVNYIRKLGYAAVSIALFDNDQPIFGVLAQYPTGELAWGGKGLGAFLNDRPLMVSSVSDKNKAVLCTGFPARFDFDDQSSMQSFWNLLASFQKVRMFGTAAVSLLKVASGAAELYVEREIMLWDIAAGLAILEGAGGTFTTSPGRERFALNVMAGNGRIAF